MQNLSREEKLKFIKSQNISISDLALNIDDVYNMALAKELCGISCFGNNDPKDEVCKNCYFNEDGSFCKKLTEHINKFKNNEYKNTKVMVKTLNGKEMKMNSLELILSKLSVKSTTKEYRMAVAVLDKASQNKPFNDVLDEIGKIISSNDRQRQQIYFYKVRKRLKEEAKINIEIVTYKYVSLMGEDK